MSTSVNTVRTSLNSEPSIFSDVNTNDQEIKKTLAQIKLIKQEIVLLIFADKSSCFMKNSSEFVTNYWHQLISLLSKLNPKFFKLPNIDPKSRKSVKINFNKDLDDMLKHINLFEELIPLKDLIEKLKEVENKDNETLPISKIFSILIAHQKYVMDLISSEKFINDLKAKINREANDIIFLIECFIKDLYPLISLRATLDFINKNKNH